MLGQCLPPTRRTPRCRRGIGFVASTDTKNPLQDARDRPRVSEGHLLDGDPVEPTRCRTRQVDSQEGGPADDVGGVGPYECSASVPTLTCAARRPTDTHIRLEVGLTCYDESWVTITDLHSVARSRIGVTAAPSFPLSWNTSLIASASTSTYN